MVIICLRGGFGNRLFQISLGMHLENEGRVVVYDLSSAESQHNNFLSFAPLSEYLKPRTKTFTKYLPAPFGKIPVIGKTLRRFCGIRYFFSDFNPEGKLPKSLPDNSLLDGYWQRNEYSTSLRSYLTKSPLFKELIHSSNQNSILYVHIRRGDYLSTKNLLELNFYEVAINYILNENVDIKTINVVTDDPDFCELYLKTPIKFNVIRKQSSFEDFMSLVGAKYILISRSTFSWWAARLGNSKVYYPTPWYPENVSLDASIIPESWLGIPQ